MLPILKLFFYQLFLFNFIFTNNQKGITPKEQQKENNLSLNYNINNDENITECELGKWGENCENNCDKACNVETKNCDKQTGECFYCNATYYNNPLNPQECLKCSTNCKDNCTVDGCVECKESKHYGTWCDKICEHCLSDLLGYHCDRTGKCYGECEHGYYTHYCNEQCPEHCYYETTYENCKQESGECDKCDKGYYPKKCEQCIDACSACNSLTECTECKEIDKYGTICSETCNKNCYRDESQTIHICNIEGRCNSCIPGYHGASCNLTCPEGCLVCNQDTDVCYECDKNYYLEDRVCYKCNDNCDECKSKDLCVECKDLTKYGNLCENNCPEHCYYEHSFTSLSSSFLNYILGFEKESNKNANRKCDRTTGDCYSCETNFTGNKCQNCILGLFGENCEKHCNKNCNLTQGNCDKDNGTCYCNKGYYGYDCSLSCPEGCLSCEQETGKCIECDIDYYNDEGICYHCPETCSKGKGCSKDECTECITGKYGLLCNKECPSHCADNLCDKILGYCINNCTGNFEGLYCNKCIFNFTGLECDKHCSPGCNIQQNVTQNCDMETGNCECKIGYYSPNCTETCPENCNTTVDNCNKTTGECSSCKDGFYGEYCNKSCSKGCAKCKQDYGECVICEDEYMLLLDNTCEECPANCTNKKCSLYGCESCSSMDTFGLFCNYTCPKDCSREYILKDAVCNRINGYCNHGCRKEHIQTAESCDHCELGYYGEDCDNLCGVGCSTPACDRSTGYCDKCNSSYYGDKCDLKCPQFCDVSVYNCEKINGTCNQCQIGYYRPNCEKCPNNCYDCSSEINCTSCKEGFYGASCNTECSKNCALLECKKETGECEGCKTGYYSSMCNETCEGCNTNCYQHNGICADNECKANFYNPINGCKGKCSQNCKDGCDLYTGECISCNSSEYWGPNCEDICSQECRDDYRSECCYAKSNKTRKNYLIKISSDALNSPSYQADTDSKYKYFTFQLGSQNETINALIDFESNAELVIFDKLNPFKNGTINMTNLRPVYNSSDSDTYKKEDISDVNKCTFQNIEALGFQATDIITLNGVFQEPIQFRINMLIATELKVETKFTNKKVINGIIGLSFLSYFNENLLKEGIIDKNMIYYSRKNNTLLFGDYPSSIRKSFDKLTTLKLTNHILFDSKVTFHAEMQGISYSLRKAYKFEKIITLSFTSDTSISLPRAYHNFFTKIYFGSNKGCYSKTKKRDTEEFYCDASKFDHQKFSALGIIMDNYTYEFSQDLLFKKVDGEYKFLFELKDYPEIILGKNFFNEFNVIFNNGNGTLNFYGKTKKFTSGFDSTDDWNVLDDGEILTPGNWTLIVIFGIAFVIIIFYLNSYCFNSKKKELGEIENEVLME